MEHCKLQIGCLIIVLYITFTYYRGKKHLRHGAQSHPLYELLLAVGAICLALDGVTAYTVNHLETVNPYFNLLLHALFLISVDSMIFALALYLLASTDALPKKRIQKLLLGTPFVANIIVVVVNIRTLSYHHGETSNYSIGVSAYTCFVMAGVYLLFTLVVFFSRRKYISARKRHGILAGLMIFVVTTTIQTIFPEVLITSIGTTIVILGAYVHQEDPAMQELSRYHSEMVMGFATLVENRDNSTGGHVRRTASYVKLLAQRLQRDGFSKELTRDYLQNLLLAAPLHDIGKISIPDAILQKPGKLTAEEFDIMKTHTVNGGRIIDETFGKLNNPQYLEIARAIALHHHEKWNGTGYPDGLSGENIPLCARIMAVADVFDAVSENRCYRPALELEECFKIIQNGSGTDFDPAIATAFLAMREQVKQVYNENK